MTKLYYPVDTTNKILDTDPAPELYRYAMRNRPAMYGTCPDGRVIAEDKDNLYSESAPHYGTVAYTRKLTEAEMYKWEMCPASPNAYTWQVGDRCEHKQSGDILIVSEQLGGNWYSLYLARKSWEDERPRFTVDRAGIDLIPVTPPPFHGDYDWREDRNTYPRDTIIYTPVNTALLRAASDKLDERIAHEVQARRMDEAITRIKMFGDEQPARQARRDRDSRNFGIVQWAKREKEIPSGVGMIERFYTHRYTRPE